MIYHFLHRDFLSNKINWVINLIIVLVCCIGAVFHPAILFILGVVLLFFAVIPLQSLTGAAWRSQHVMSRNYLLSLPVPRRKMFFIVQMRALVFALPIIIYALLMPFYSPFFASVVLPASSNYAVYFLMLILSVAWMINSAIYSNLIFEKITSYLTKIERTKSWTVSMGIFFTELALVISSFVQSGEGIIWMLVSLVVVMAIAAYRFRSTQRAWLGQ